MNKFTVFFEMYHKHLRESETCKEAYLKAEAEHVEKIGYSAYTSHNTFKNAINYHFNKKR